MEIKGCIPAMATPMRANGALDLDAIPALVDALIQNGAHGIFAVGSMGEAASLDADERLSVFRATVKAARGRVPVLAGTGFVTTRETIDMTKRSEDTGVSAVSVITPYYWKLSQEALYRHYAAVIQSTSLPVFAYNLPGNTLNNIDPETIGRLYKQEGLSGAKDSSANWPNTKGYMDNVDAGFTMLVGEDTLCLDGLMYGSKGSISAPANAYTYVFAEIYNRFSRGDIQGAQAAQEDWIKIIRAMSKIGGFPGNFKRVTHDVTAPVGIPRAPVIPADEQEYARLKPEMDAIAAKYR